MYRFAQLTNRVTDVYFMKFQFYGSFSNFKCNSSIDQRLCNGNSIFLFPILLTISFFLYNEIDLCFTDIKKKQIVEHTDDLQYLFTSKYTPKFTDDSSLEARTVEKYTNLLASFARNG